jgi:hypothetical protein
MLENKDYCDYETCVALKKLGFNDVTHYFFNKDSVRTPRIPLYEAQKFLREEKNIIVEVFVDDDSDTPITYNIYKDGECVCHHHGKYWSIKEWNEALAEGIKSAVKNLKEK